jgi:transcription elongation factor GreA
MSDEKEYLTKEKHDALIAELEHLKKDCRKEIAENLEFAKALGDLSENAEYHDAREEQAKVEDRILKIEYLLKNSEIVALHHSNIANIGTAVTVKKEGEKENIVYKIVGSEEANMAEGKISFKSPLGQAMLGKKKGDSFSFSAPKGTFTYKVIDIE